MPLEPDPGALPRQRISRTRGFLGNGVHACSRATVWLKKKKDPAGVCQVLDYRLPFASKCVTQRKHNQSPWRPLQHSRCRRSPQPSSILSPPPPHLQPAVLCKHNDKAIRRNYKKLCTHSRNAKEDACPANRSARRVCSRPLSFQIKPVMCTLLVLLLLLLRLRLLLACACFET